MIESLPVVSVIIPSFNQGIYIEQTLLSVFSQDYPNIEVIVVDNCSTDSTSDILSLYHDRIDLLIVEPDKGQSDAINKGFTHASGSFLTWLNSDDYFYSSRSISEVMNVFAKNNSLDFVYSNVFLTYESKKPCLLRGERFSFNRQFSSLRVPIPQQCSILRKSVFTNGIRLDCSLNYLLDRDFFLRISEKYSIFHLNLPLACFRQHSQAKSFSSTDNWANEFLTLYSYYYSDNSPFDNLPPKNKTFASVYLQVSSLLASEEDLHFCSILSQITILWQYY